MHLRHRHGDAAGDAGKAEQREQRVGVEAERGVGAVRGGIQRGGPRWTASRRRSTRASGSMAAMQTKPMTTWFVRQPYVWISQLHDRRPDGAAQVVARGADRDGDAAPAREPVRDVGDQRREGGGAADADQASWRAQRRRCSAPAPEAMKATPSSRLAPMTGATMPKRSTRRPMTTAPRPKPSMVSV